ncbi:TetR/AcrR family transcriptional regulator [Massilia sp. YMA4]|uniref:TetR/AcrR family transcriptional regulator n=1 Tax=[Empedobacter] haloabium TaxID=592317 RepID=A0ABZ1UP99_9BURK|nr:TetR/AcrR family transcriptional regulator [Massilia sp. YMA4]AXA92075.1 TetR/AcrR family transcriptional regulator [Massilia sp. YMA4]
MRKQNDNDATPEETPARKAPRRTLTRLDWIDAATEILVSKSVDAIHPATLARDLGITIGSFYYHFKDRNDLLASVLRQWHERTTAQVMEEYAGMPIDELAYELMALPLHGLTARHAAMVEFAIRAWARRDEMARQAVLEVDQQRLGLYTDALRNSGFSKAEAENRAFLIYSFQMSQALLWDVNDEKARKRQLNFAKKLFLQPLSGTST